MSSENNNLIRKSVRLRWVRLKELISNTSFTVKFALQFVCLLVCFVKRINQSLTLSCVEDSKVDSNVTKSARAQIVL